jgi:hypothetical protein
LTLVFFTDRDLGHRFPELLAAAGLTVERHRDHFPPDCPDHLWLEKVGRRGWIALTHDARIRYKPNEKAAVLLHKVTLLVLVGKAPFHELAESFVRTVPRVAAFLRKNPPPVIAKVYRPSPAELPRRPLAPGRVERWYPEREGARK